MLGWSAFGRCRSGATHRAQWQWLARSHRRQQERRDFFVAPTHVGGSVADMSHSSPICGTVTGHRRSRRRKPKTLMSGAAPSVCTATRCPRKRTFWPRVGSARWSLSA